MNFKSSSLKKVLLTSFSLIISTTLVFSATIKGKLTNAATKEVVEFASVVLKKAGTNTFVVGTQTDFDGEYELKDIPAGTYDLYFMSLGSDTGKVKNVTLTANEVKIISYEMVEASEELGGVTIEIEISNNTTQGLLVEIENADVVSSGVSNEQLKQEGTSDAAGASSKISGASVEDGKYMVMRGLGDRYSITQLNGLTMPSADPYRNSASLDIIPVDMIDNLTTIKTFSPNQPGSFTGGKMDITTKSIPKEFYMTFGLSTSFNTNTTFNNNFLADGARSSTDWLGFDNGLRARPTALTTYKDYISFGQANSTAAYAGSVKYPEERAAFNATARSLTNSYQQQRKTAPLNQGFNFAIGDSYRFGKDSSRKLGLNYGMNYSKDYSFYQNQEFGIYQIATNNSEDLVPNRLFSDTKGSEETQMGAIFTANVKLNANHSFGIMEMFNHSAASTAQMYEGFWLETGGLKFNTRSTSFIERGIYNTQINGEHKIDALNGLRINWVAGRNESSQLEPDTRLFAYTYTVDQVDGDTNYTMRKQDHELPTNFFRDLHDKQYTAKVDFELPMFNQDSQKHSKDVIKFGASFLQKDREFNEHRYELQTNGLDESSAWTSFNEADGDFNKFFTPTNFGIVDTQFKSNGDVRRYTPGNFYSDQTVFQNSYTGTTKIFAYYLMANYKFFDKMLVSAGVRSEGTNMHTQSQDTGVKSGNIDRVDYLPGVNIKYELSDTTSLRFAISQTIARPNMREISPFASVGGIGAPIVLGNVNLDRTLITNYDVRYERFPKKTNRGSMFSVSAYYKNFKNPIIWQLTPQASTAELKPINVPTAEVYGLEVEIRRSLGFISPKLKKLMFGGNFSLIKSRVDKSQSELDALKASGRVGIASTRPFQGQSPYIINAMLTYKSDSLKWENTVSFNIWGDRLSYVTDALNPDVYEKSRPSLNFNSSKTINKNFSVSLKVKNILNMQYRKVFLYKNTEDNYQSYKVGRTISFGLSYKFTPRPPKPLVK